MKQFVKALSKTDPCFHYLYNKFPHLPKAKLDKGIFVGPDIHNFMLDYDFETTMNTENDVGTTFRKRCFVFSRVRNDKN